MRNKVTGFAATMTGKVIHSILAFSLIAAFLFRISLMIGASIDAQTATGVSAINQIVDTIIIFVSVYLGYLHGDIYRLNLSKKQKLDERLTSLRRRVYEKSFQLLVTMLFIAMFVFNFAVLGSEGFSLHFSREAGNSFSVGIIFFILSIPALIATIQKDR